MSEQRIRQLTREEFDNLIETIKNDEHSYIGNGSSRAVYRVEYCGNNYAVKIAGQPEGRAQNQIEMDLYEEHGGEYLNPILAAYKDILLVCDEIDPLDTDMVEEAWRNEDVEDFIEAVEWADWYTRDELIDIWANCRAAVHFLTECQGDTWDNFQIGTNYNGRVVAYDYGYVTGVSGLVGDIEGLIDFGNHKCSLLWSVIYAYDRGIKVKYYVEAIGVRKGESSHYFTTDEDEFFEEVKEKRFFKHHYSSIRAYFVKEDGTEEDIYVFKSNNNEGENNYD